MLSLLLSLIVFSVFVLSDQESHAWFTTNKEASANNLQLKAEDLDISIAYYRKGAHESEYTRIDSFSSVFDGMMPGDTVSLKVEYTSNEARAYKATVCFDCPDGCEAPLLQNEKYYYFGTQLKINATGEFLVTPPTDFLSYTSPQVPERLELGTLEIAAGASSYIEVQITFVNYDDVDQSIYQGFGSNGDAVCYRVISSSFEELSAQGDD
jgi:hypothetical protein